MNRDKENLAEARAEMISATSSWFRRIFAQTGGESGSAVGGLGMSSNVVKDFCNAQSFVMAHSALK